MSKSTIISKAMRCVDEVSAGSELPMEEGLFPVDEFLGEAVRWVVDSVPAHKLGEGEELILDSFSISNGVGRGILPDDFARLIYFKASDWKRPVTTPIYDTDPRYMQQGNKVLRGNPSHPVVAICKGGTELEYYTTKVGNSYEAKYMTYSTSYIPAHLEDMISWKLAEVVLLSISDVNAASVCTARINDIMQQLSL